MARAPVIAAEPKSASGSVWQSVAELHADGASTIHSAEVVSSTVARSRLVNERWRVRFVERERDLVAARRRRWPASGRPGRTISVVVREAAGHELVPGA